METKNLNETPKIFANSYEIEYAESLKKLLFYGTNPDLWESNRTNNKTISTHQTFMFPFIADNFPLIKGKKVNPLMSFKEALWILLGRNDLKWLNDRGVTYWDEWKLSLYGDYPVDKYLPGYEFGNPEKFVGTIGFSYGTAARHFTGRIRDIDNWRELIQTAYSDPSSRRLIFSLWDPNNAKASPVPPCAVMYIFNCHPYETETGIIYSVDMDAIMRSNDAFLGAPYDFMLAGFFLKLFCLQLNVMSKNKEKFIPRHIFYTASNYHIYENQRDAIRQYLKNFDEDINSDNSIIKNGEVNIEIIFENKKNLEYLHEFEIRDFMENLSFECNDNSFRNIPIYISYDDKFKSIKCDVVV
jgi:thymidylate synthase